MSQQEEFDIPLEQLELVARECERRKSIRRKSKMLLHFDSVTHQLEKYKQKLEQGKDKGQEQEAAQKGMQKQKIQQIA